MEKKSTFLYYKCIYISKVQSVSAASFRYKTLHLQIYICKEYGENKNDKIR